MAAWLYKSLLCRVFEPENRDVVPLARLVATWSRCGAHSQASLNGTESLFLKTLYVTYTQLVLPSLRVE